MSRSQGIAWAGVCWLFGVTTTACTLAAPDFETEVIPVLTKSGCNSAACHGAAIGRGGFRLSLLGYDPQADYERLVQEYKGRRVNLAHPAKSLVLRKPSVRLLHEGGLRLSTRSDGYRIVREWIRSGAPRRSRRSLQALEVFPTSKTLQAIDESFTLKVVARFSDGTSSDVTQWAVYKPNDSAAVHCTQEGEVTALQRGQSSVMVRFLGEVGCVTVTVPLSDKPLAASSRPRANFIDDHVNQTLDQLRLGHSPRTDDVTIVRRIFLDVIGTLPDPAEVKKFLGDRSTQKRTRLVDRLMSRPEFVQFWSYKWGDLLRIESRRLGRGGAAAFHKWVREQVARNAPLDQMAHDLLLALGDSNEVGPANFHRVAGDALTEAEYVSHVFLGVRLQCANCHNHPLDRWTQDDYHGLAAIFARVSREQVVALEPRGEVIHPKTGEAAVPRIPGKTFLTTKEDTREQFARWLTAKDNPFFARAAVNRIWRELMGRGLVEPTDDHRATNPSTHPELLDALTQDFVEHGFDVRHTMRTIVASQAYQRSSLSTAANRSDNRYYSKAIVRPLSPTVMVDAVVKVAGVPEELGALPAGTRAISLGDARITSVPLDLLGRCSRTGGCTPDSSSMGSLPLTLHTINGAWLNAKIRHPEGRLQKLLQEKQTDADIVTTLYQAALSRKPTIEELDHWQTQLATQTSEQRTTAFQDFLWALLNSAEFCCNH